MAGFYGVTYFVGYRDDFDMKVGVMSCHSLADG